ncbi:MAG TPA: von Willebrand factor type A domain-containing protein [Pontiella sp.]
MKKCKSYEKQLVAYIHGELDKDRFLKLEEHLETCGNCRAELDALRITLNLLDETLVAVPAPQLLSPWWKFAARQRESRPTLSDYWYSPRLRAVLISSAAFSVLFFLSINVVVFQVLKKGGHDQITVAYEIQESDFSPPPSTQRPAMALKNPKVKIKSSSRPRTPEKIMARSEPVGLFDTGLADLCYMGSAVVGEAGVQMFGYAMDTDAAFNTEQYNHIAENDFLPVLQNPLSTFSIDVDRASYANVRRYLNDGMLPPEDAVRIEELINYFNYDYPQPQGRDPFSVAMEIMACPWNREHQLALIGLQGIKVEPDHLPANNLVFLLDVSGSMDSPDKLPLLKSAMRLLVEQLRPDDRVSMVVYAGAAGLVLEPTADKEKILSAIDRLSAGGSTAGGAGIQLAYKTAQENFIKGGNNRVILATDGDFNVGISSDGDLVRLIEKKRESGVYLSVLGFGTGNYKDSKMEQLANKGNGNYAYIDSILEAKKVLVTEMGGTLVTIAKDVRVQIEFNPAQVKAYRLIGYENRMMAAEDFNDDMKDAGELGSGHTVTALYELIPADAEEQIRIADQLKYQRSTVVNSDELMTVKLRYKQPDGDTSRLISHAARMNELQSMERVNVGFAGAVAEFGLLLRDSKYKGSASYESVLERAREYKGDDPHGYRAGFIELVERARLLERTD